MSGMGYCDRHVTGYTLATGCEDCKAWLAEQSKPMPPRTLKEALRAQAKNHAKELLDAARSIKIYTREELTSMLDAQHPAGRRTIFTVMAHYGLLPGDVVKMRPSQRIEYILARQQGLPAPVALSNSGRPRVYTTAVLRALVYSTAPADRKEIVSVLKYYGRSLSELVQMRNEERIRYIIEQQEANDDQRREDQEARR